MDFVVTASGWSQLLVSVVVVLTVAWVVRVLIQQPRNLPPGPRGLPIIGIGYTILRSKISNMEMMASFAKEYGEIFHFRVGSQRVVCLNSYAAIKRAFQNPLLQGRLSSRIRYNATGLDNHGLILSHGENWREQRHFAFSVFRSLGVGKKTYEDIIGAELEQLSYAFGALSGEPFDPDDLITSAIANVICTLTFGTQYEYSDSNFKKVVGLIADYFTLIGAGGGLANLPIPGLARLPFGPAPSLTRVFKGVHVFISEMIVNHQSTFDPDAPRDFIDLYLKKMDDLEGSETSLSLDNLRASIFDLFLAGTETTSSSLKWSLLFLMSNPDVQAKVQEELDRVVGRDRLPKLSDRPKLPYTSAVILECLRHARVAPLGIAHVATEDTTLDGYTIPKGTVMLGNLWTALFDEEAWPQAADFTPERFLTPHGELEAREDMIVFGTGRRICLGERLARMEMFVFLTGLLHHFIFKKAAGSPPLPMEGKKSFSHTTKPFQTCAIKRDS